MVNMYLFVHVNIDMWNHVRVLEQVVSGETAIASCKSEHVMFARDLNKKVS